MHEQGATHPFNLQGMAIGNGLTNPAIQYGSYADFSFANGLISKGLQSTVNTVSLSCEAYEFILSQKHCVYVH